MLLANQTTSFMGSSPELLILHSINLMVEDTDDGSSTSAGRWEYATEAAHSMALLAKHRQIE